MDSNQQAYGQLQFGRLLPRPTKVHHQFFFNSFIDHWDYNIFLCSILTMFLTYFAQTINFELFSAPNLKVVFMLVLKTEISLNLSQPNLVLVTLVRTEHGEG